MTFLMSLASGGPRDAYIHITTVNGKSVTNETIHIPKVDEVCRWVSYIVVDDEIAWNYLMTLKADGSLNYITVNKYDAKEYDPKYRKIIKEVETQVRAEMEKNGSYGKLGSCHVFWSLKQKMLKAKGIQWRSPAELHPNTNYD